MRRIMQLIVMALLVGGCSLTGHSPPSEGRGGFTLLWGEETDPADTNPLMAGDVHAFDIISLVYETLTTPNKDLTVGPGLAEKWHQTSDTSWRFKLRNGVKFSNGRPLTSEDIVDTWNAYKKAKVLSFLFPNVSSVTAVDRLTFDVKLTAPVPDLPASLELFWVLPGKELTSGTFDPDKQLLGTGPFVSGSHVKGISWTFQRNPHYWKQGFPRARLLQIKFIPDDASRIAAVRTGEADFVTTANPDAQKILAGNPQTKVIVQGSTDHYYLLLNPNGAESKFRDKRVRQAVALAIDRKQVVDNALGGLGELTAVTPRNLPDTCDPAGVLGAPGRDVEKAKALVTEAGAKNMSFRIFVTTAFGALQAPKIAQVIQQNLNDIGLKAEISVLDAGAYFNAATKGKYDAALNIVTGGSTPSLILGYMDPVKTPVFSQNVPHDPTNIALVRKAIEAHIGPERHQAIAKACASINDLAYWIPLMTKPTVIVYRSDHIVPAFNPVEPVQMPFRRLSEFSRAS